MTGFEKRDNFAQNVKSLYFDVPLPTLEPNEILNSILFSLM